MLYLRALTTFFLVLIFGCSNAQDRFSKHQIGFSMAVALIPEKTNIGNYSPLLLKGKWGFNMAKEANLSTLNNRFIFFLEPQFNPVFISGDIKSVEFGCNFGLQYDLKISKKDYFYFGIGTGPHYITADVSKQHRGYIFSDNFNFGWNHRIVGPVYSHLQYSFRHISNAGIMKPNAGIDNHLLSFGFAKFID